jgi:hypothetical protein
LTFGTFSLFYFFGLLFVSYLFFCRFLFGFFW